MQYTENSFSYKYNKNVFVDGVGVEPTLQESESCVLPLNEPPKRV